jgi:hypothetical protein
MLSLQRMTDVPSREIVRALIVTISGKIQDQSILTKEVKIMSIKSEQSPQNPSGRNDTSSPAVTTSEECSPEHTSEMISSPQNAVTSSDHTVSVKGVRPASAVKLSVSVHTSGLQLEDVLDESLSPTARFLNPPVLRMPGELELPLSSPMSSSCGSSRSNSSNYLMAFFNEFSPRRRLKQPSTAPSTTCPSPSRRCQPMRVAISPAH